MALKRLTIVIKLGADYAMIDRRQKLTRTCCAGTSSIVDENTHEPILSILTLIVETVAKLHREGHNVVLVSSGAVGVGLRRMDVEERPKHLPRIQVYNTELICAGVRFASTDHGVLGIGCRWPV